MGTRVLRAGNFYRPGWVGAVCDARVLGLHVAHVRGCRRGRLCRDQGKGWRAWGGGTWFSISSKKVESQGGSWRTRGWYRWNALDEHVLVEPNIVSYSPVSRQPSPKTCGQQL